MQRNNWPNNRDGLMAMASELEKANVTSVLLPYSPEGGDFSLYLPAILRTTNRIRMMLAIAAYSTTPEYLSKTYETLSHFGAGRVDLNLVAGKYEQDKFDMMVEYYPGDTSMIDAHDKRVALTEPWLEQFYRLKDAKKFESKLCVVGSSETTLRIADKFADYIIIGEYQVNDKYLSKLTNTRPILTIDPLILEDGEHEEDVKYQDYKFKLPPKHPIKGTHDEVVAQLREKSNKFGVNDFMVITDQLDLTRIYKVIKELTGSPTA
jgi:hypothetical protein